MRTFRPFPQQNTRIGLLGVAFDENSSYMRGAALAPQRIREAFFCDSSNQWTEDETYLGADRIFADAGDITPSQADMPIETEQAAGRLYEAGLKVMAFGGDHSVTYPLVKAAAKAHPNLSILHFDAHPDLYDNFEDNPHSHASPFARIMEAGLAKRLVQVGIRTINGHQREQANRFGVEVLTMKNWQDVFNINFDSPLYITFDMDCLDPAFAPGISHWEPGGLSTREALSVIQSLQANIIGADVVELNPTRDPLNVTEMVAAKVFKEIAAKMLMR
ncbi:agmatinase [Candidatus Villigracilis affinis]|uniref:agmatinase n=1 Tax=Candidatus Villigracilis affinis TaxID=3140682 RepID=UPI002A1D2D0D|nr:agmatinase [Anaerolineales bacterium]